MPWNILRVLAFLIAVGTGIAFVVGRVSAPEFFAALTSAALLWLLADVSAPEPGACRLTSA